MELDDRFCLRCGEQVPNLRQDGGSDALDPNSDSDDVASEHDSDSGSGHLESPPPELDGSSGSTVEEGNLSLSDEDAARSIDERHRGAADHPADQEQDTTEPQSSKVSHLPGDGNRGVPAWLRSTRTAAQWSKRLLYLLALVAGAWFVVDLMGYDLVAQASFGVEVSGSDAESIDTYYQNIAALWLLAYLVTAVVFLVWFRKAYQNLDRFSVRGLDYSANWALGGFFVPILNLFRPYQVAREIAKASSDQMFESRTSWKEKETPSIIKWWWGLFLVSNWVAWSISRLSPEDLSNLAALQRFYLADAISNCLLVVSAIVATRMIEFITAQQEGSLEKMQPFKSRISGA